MTELTATRLRELLRYDPETGHFYWLRFKGRAVSARNGKRAGHLSDPKSKSLRYRESWIVGVDGLQFGASRLAVLYMTGSFPRHQVDHRDGDRLNNKWDNLREATQSQNGMNKRCYKNNRLGLKGVIEVYPGKFRAKLDINNRRVHVGYFDSAEQAFAARLAAIQAAHGNFARAA